MSEVAVKQTSLAIAVALSLASATQADPARPALPSARQLAAAAHGPAPVRPSPPPISGVT